MINQSEICFWDKPQLTHRIYQINYPEILGGELKENKNAGGVPLFWRDTNV